MLFIFIEYVIFHKSLSQIKQILIEQSFINPPYVVIYIYFSNNSLSYINFVLSCFVMSSKFVINCNIFFLLLSLTGDSFFNQIGFP